MSSASVAMDFVSKKSKIGSVHVENESLKVGTSLKKWAQPQGAVRAVRIHRKKTHYILDIR